MSPYTFAAWLIIAVGTLFAAIVVNLGQPGPASVRLENEVAFPTLREEPDAVRRILIESAGKSFTIERRPDGTWITPDKDGYLVEAADVRALIVGLSDMRLVEAKTAREERFPRIEVEEPSAEGAKSRRVRLLGDGDAVLAEAILGRARSRFTGGVEGGTYIRRVDETQAWLASGRVDVKPEVGDWLNNDLMHLAGTEVVSVEMTPPEGEPIRLERPGSDGNYTLEGLPEGQMVEPSQASRLASGLSFLTFDDVAPRERFQLPAARYRGAFRTAEGVEVTLQMGAIDNSDWALFSARFIEPDGIGEEAAAAARREAEEIAARVEGWIYKLPEHVATRLKLGFDELHSPDGTS